MRKKIRNIIQFLIGFIGLLLLWQASIHVFDVPFYILPTPYEILIALIDGFYQNDFLLHAWVTLSEALSGFVLGSICGIIIGALVSQFRILQKTLLPYIVAFQVLPKVALAPLLVIWFGFGMQTRVLMVMMLTLFPVLVNSLVGFSSVPHQQIELMYSLTASRWQIFRKLKIPSALPLIFSGLHIAIIQSVLAAVVAEFIAAERGLGVMNLKLVFDFDIPGSFATLVVLATMATLLYVLVAWIKNRTIFWLNRDEFNPV
jgi:NitT/TauT family transport system permease protein